MYDFGEHPAPEIIVVEGVGFYGRISIKSVSKWEAPITGLFMRL